MPCDRVGVLAPLSVVLQDRITSRLLALTGHHLAAYATQGKQGALTLSRCDFQWYPYTRYPLEAQGSETSKQVAEN